MPVKEDKLKPMLVALAGTRAEGLIKFHEDHEKEILVARGSRHNHQYWSGGYHDHIVQCFVLAQDLYARFSRFKKLPFTIENAIVVLYLHDIEKIFNYGLRPERYSERIKRNKEVWYLGILPYKYGVWLDEIELNALEYIHGEGDDYTPDERKMGSLAAFCHAVDVISARVFHEVRELCLESATEGSST